MPINYFSYYLPNLIIGLAKGSRVLGPYSSEFKKLGYQTHKIEPSFRTTGGYEVNPDAIVISVKIGNTLIFEWTSSTSLGDDKRRQIERYSNITVSDLATPAAVPTRALKTFDTVLVLKQVAISSFVEYLEHLGTAMPIVIFRNFEEDGEYSLEKEAFDFAEANTDSFFSNRMVFSKIPTGYISFCIDDINQTSLVSSVVKHLVSAIIKNIRSFEITDFCERVIPVWGVIDTDKKREIARVITQIFNRLSRYDYGAELIKRQAGPPPRWVIISKEDFIRRKRYFQTRLDSFISSTRGEPLTEELFGS